MKPIQSAVCASALLALTASPAAFGVILTNDFSTDPGWTGVNNTSGGNNYGYSSGTSQAGGSAGEVGGTFARRGTEDYYADTFLAGNGFAAGGNSTLRMAHQASGRFDALNVATMNNVVEIGHRSASTTDESFLGLVVLESSSTHVRVGAAVVLSSGTPLFSPFQTVPINGDYAFSYSYNPSGGAFGDGQLSLLVTNASVAHSFSVDLTSSQRDSVVLDAFGIGGLRVNNTSNQGDVFMDDVIYTAIPEPSGLALLALGGVMLRWRRPNR